MNSQSGGQSLCHRDFSFYSVIGQNIIYEWMLAPMVGVMGEEIILSILHKNSSLVHSSILFFLAPCARRDADIKTFTTVLSYLNLNLLCPVIHVVTKENHYSKDSANRMP